MSVGKGSPHRRQTIDVGSFRLWVATQVTDPMIEVIHGNEENVGPIVRRSYESGQGSKKKGQEVSFHGKFVLRVIPFMRGAQNREGTVWNCIVWGMTCMARLNESSFGI
tara:strand:- start:3227 stop:3553 length:327 start_codon:yes stop_codon:yes gene_type:complete